MALGTVAEIKASAADWLNRTDLSSQIDDFFTMALAEATRKLDIPLGESVIEKTISSSEATDKKFYEPANSLNVISITDEKGNRLEEVPFQEYRAYIDTGGSAGIFATVDSYIYIGPPPAENDKFTIQYKSLSSASFTAYQGGSSTAIANILLYGTLMNACVYLKDDNRVSMYKQRFDESIIDANRQDRMHSRIKDESITINGGPLA